MALLLFLALILIVAGTVLLFAQNWLPQLASMQSQMDSHLQTNLLVFGLLFAATQVTLAYFTWRYRTREGMAYAEPAQPSGRFELFWLVIAAIIFFGLNTLGVRLWAARGSHSGARPLQVEVTGEQFRWYFRYPGADRKFGPAKPELVDASLGNPLGIDPSDAASTDDRVTGVLVLPKGREVEIRLRAHDVIHSFFVPSFRVKQDAVPGMITSLRFTPAKVGEFDLACAELCGMGHHEMNAKVKVVPMDEFERWLRGGSR